LGLACLADPRYLELDGMPSRSVLGLIFLPDPHYLILLGVPMKDDYYFGRSKKRYAFPWACQGLGLLPSLMCLRLNTLLNPKAFGFWLAPNQACWGLAH